MSTDLTRNQLFFKGLLSERISDPSKANELIQKPIRTFVSELQKDFHIRSFRVEPGKISVDAVKI